MIQMSSYEMNCDKKPSSASQETVITHVYSAGPPVGPEPSPLQCPSCRKAIFTRVANDATTKTHLMAAMLCLFGCWPCVWLAYFTDSCKNANHYCVNCHAFIGTYKR